MMFRILVEEIDFVDKIVFGKIFNVIKNDK